MTKASELTSRQIAIKRASAELRAILDTASKATPITLRLGERIILVVGDTHAIWRTHNMANLNEYDRLFDLLALRPDEPILFWATPVKPTSEI